jgi:adenylate cyclase
LRCFFAMRAALAAEADRFVQRFGVQPELRAALHLSEVIAGEVGQVRRAIVFHGDVMNTTGRLEQATREIACFFIASAEALASLGPSPPRSELATSACWRCADASSPSMRSASNIRAGTP